MRVPKRAAIFLLIVLGGLTACFAVESWVVPRLVLRGLEKALKVRIEGRIHPDFFKTSFRLENVRTAWDQKVRIFSGQLNIDYDLRPMTSGRLALRVQGNKVAAELLGDWAQLAGGQKVVFDDLFVNFVVGVHGIEELKALRAESPTIHFNFGPSKQRQA